MDWHKLKPVVQAISITFFLYLLHETLFYAFDVSQHSFVKPLFFIYSFFAVFSTVIAAVLIFVKRYNFDNVGMVCIILTTIEMLAAFLVFGPILESESGSATFEKFNFLIVFGIFLTVQTLIAIGMLKDKP